MIDPQVAGMLRFIGLVGLLLSLAGWALAERAQHRKTLVSLCAGVALLSASIYLLGAVASAESGAARLIPRFP